MNRYLWLRGNILIDNLSQTNAVQSLLHLLRNFTLKILLSIRDHQCTHMQEENVP